ncbi:NAD(P)H-binding [Phytophthora infestans]|uniref:NAD(P)H-binding n=1 Tax=Phytophthora infestans TaxID=4787 RepID=A0A833W2E7_PHYIN|nr:NAD(P)H-binding [Phytophthora infestans]KAF4138705.1 NAD(P)H-binding [Phytophthora infestans]KAF4147036.1 NAD(P)H-binding [Phytophthora infestans]
MRVAVVGTGSFAKHYINELPVAGHEVVVLTRSHKEFLDDKKWGPVEQRITDYSSVPQLVELLSDCDALVSTISDLSQTYVDVHMALIAACKQTPKCKRFIPSGYGGNAEDFREGPSSLFHHNAVVRDALLAQTELEWTAVCIGWIMDHVVPSGNRIHSDAGPVFPLDLHTRAITIPGSGNDAFTMTSVRDLAKAVAQLLESPEKWRPYTFVQGEETTWLKLAKVMKTTGDMSDLKISFESLDHIRDQKKDSFFAVLTTEVKLFVPSGAFKFDQAKVQRDRAEFFPNVHFRTVTELVETAKKDANAIV